jgi:hypothetical protein
LKGLLLISEPPELYSPVFWQFASIFHILATSVEKRKYILCQGITPTSVSITFTL